MSQNKIGFITSAPELLSDYFPTPAEPALIPTEPPFTPDDHVAAMALRKSGFDVEPLIWGTEIDKVRQYQLIIIRSPWDYMNTPQKTTEFLNWLDLLEENNINIENKIPFIRWLFDKNYLKDLETFSIQIVPTKIIPCKTCINIPEIYCHKGPIVLKPCVSAAGKGLYFIDSEQKAYNLQDRVQNSVNIKEYILQPYLPEIKTAGEWSLVFFNGVYSHSVQKNTSAENIFVQAEKGGRLKFLEPPAEVISKGKNIYKKLIKSFHSTTHFKNSSISKTWHPLYLRLDLIPIKDKLYLSECEGFEPELFFRAKPASKNLFCDTVARKL